MNPITTTLAILLAVSMAGNAFFGRAYLGQRDKATVAVVETKQATVAAVECSKGTDSLALQARQREVTAAPARRHAQEKATQAGRRADAILTTPPAAPGDDCRSAQARVDTWWGNRTDWVKP